MALIICILRLCTHRCSDTTGAVFWTCRWTGEYWVLVVRWNVATRSLPPPVERPPSVPCPTPGLRRWSDLKAQRTAHRAPAPIAPLPSGGGGGLPCGKQRKSTKRSTHHLHLRSAHLRSDYVRIRLYPRVVLHRVGGGGARGGATPRFWTPTTPPTHCWPEAPCGGGGGGQLASYDPRSRPPPPPGGVGGLFFF